MTDSNKDQATEQTTDRTTRYQFYLETEKHGYCAWDCLTLLEAKKMYNLTKKRYALTADNITRYGWEEMR